MLAGAEGEGVGEEKAERMGGKAVLCWVSQAARAPHSLWGWLSQPSSLNLPVAMAGLAHHEVPRGRRVDQSKLPNASLFYAGFVVPCTAINLHVSHCPF